MYGPEWRSSLELGRTRAQCPSPTIKRSGLTGIIIEETHDPAGCTRRGVPVYPDPWGEHSLIMLMLAYTCMETHVDATAAMSRRPQENPCSGRPSMLSPVRWVAGNGPFEVCGRWSGGAHPAS